MCARALSDGERGPRAGGGAACRLCDHCVEKEVSPVLKFIIDTQATFHSTQAHTHIRGKGYSSPRHLPINGLCNSRLCRPRRPPSIAIGIAALVLVGGPESVRARCALCVSQQQHTHIHLSVPQYSTQANLLPFESPPSRNDRSHPCARSDTDNL